jgi:vancomycin aglycone glucosyltransferase
MRVLLSAIGSRGDVQPLVAVALKLAAAGQQARLCVPAEFQDWIERLGFPVTPIGPQAPEPGTPPERLRQSAAATVADQFTAIATAASDCDVIVAAALLPAVMPAARSVAELLGIRYAFASFCPAFLPSGHQPPLRQPSTAQPSTAQPAETSNLELWAGQRARLNGRLGEALNRQRELVRLDPVDDVMGHITGARPWLAADPVLAPWPGPADEADEADEAVLPTGAWVLPDDRPLPGDLEAFLEAGEPPVYAGFGSMPMPAKVADVLLRAARRAGRRIVLSSGRAGLAPTGQETVQETDCLVIGEVNERELFRRVAAVIHHGGAGTTTVAGLAGVPQVIVPQRYDQPYWARRVHELGIGIGHPPGPPPEDSLTDAIGQALQPETAARARSVSAAMASNGAENAAGLIAASA